MTPVQPRDMEPVRPAHETKTRETPRPEAKVEPLGFGWTCAKQDFGEGVTATVYSCGDTLTVTRSKYGLDVEAIDSTESHRKLAYLFGFFERGGR